MPPRPTGERPLVFTGDLANEFLVDYHEELYRGGTYYSLPRLAPVALRSFLVRGLDTCHREVGVFEAWNLSLIQPYAVAVDTYMRLPDAFLRLPDRKERLCQEIFGDAIPDYVLNRPKARARLEARIKPEECWPHASTVASTRSPCGAASLTSMGSPTTDRSIASSARAAIARERPRSRRWRRERP